MRYLRTMCAAALTIMLMAACAPSVTTTVDPVRGTTQHRMRHNTLASESLFGPTVQLNIARRVSESGSGRNWLLVDLYGTSWFFIERGGSLTLRVDGENITFRSPDGSNRNRQVLYGGDIRETAEYSVRWDQLEQIANANEVIVRLQGSRGYLIRHFSEANFEAFRDFLAEHDPRQHW